MLECAITLRSSAKYGEHVAELVWRYCELLGQAIVVHSINNCIVLGKYYRVCRDFRGC